jgi:N6-adenosine-specific RNA methylase IME4
MTAPRADNLPFPPVPNQRFAVASIDPPWHFDTRAPVKDPAADRSPQRHYPTADIDHLKTIPMGEILADDAWVFLWITSPLMVTGVHLDLARAWGLEVSGRAFVWLKLWNDFETGILARTPLLERDLAFGGGYTTRKNAEDVVLLKRGCPRRMRADIREVIISPRREHSRKPEEFYRRVEHFALGDRIDMFAGADRPGWTRWGWGHREGEGERFAGGAA